jgi:hypothetical protein
MKDKFHIPCLIVLFSVLIICAPKKLQSQYSNLKLESSQLIFEKIYELDSASSEEIEKLIKEATPRTNGITDFQKSEDIVTARIDGIFIDYKKYGGRWGNTPAVLNYPFFGDLTILWKEGKYRVIVTNMYFKTDGFGIMKCSEIFLKNRGTELRTGTDAVTAGMYIEKHLSDLFLFNPIVTEW